MPLKSKAQVRKFGALLREGKISKSTFQHWLDATPDISKLPERVSMTKKAFVESFEKVAAVDKKNLYKALEYGGLGALAATDIHSALKANKEGNKEERTKALINAGALGALMGATHLAGH